MRTRHFILIAALVAAIVYGPAAIGWTWDHAVVPLARVIAGVVIPPAETAPAPEADEAEAAPQGATGGLTAPDTEAAPEAGPNIADGPVEEEELGRSVWNGASFNWDNVPAELKANEFLVAHGDLRAKGESAIAVFKTAKAAKTYLRHGTWAMILVTVPAGESLDDYLEALNERLGSGYSLVLRP